MTNYEPKTRQEILSYSRASALRQVRSESFESFSDLMTLLAIALIVVTVMLGLEFSSTTPNADAIQPLLQEAQKKGQPANVELPEDTIILTFRVSNYDAILYQSAKKEITFRGLPPDLHFFLDSHYDIIRNADHVFIVTVKTIQGKEPPPQLNDYVVSALDWFRARNMSSPVLLFTSP